MYDPSIGRWLEEDPKGFDAGDTNLHRYVHNNPPNLTDPSGLQSGRPLGPTREEIQREQWFRGRWTGSFDIELSGNRPRSESWLFVRYVNFTDTEEDILDRRLTRLIRALDQVDRDLHPNGRVTRWRDLDPTVQERLTRWFGDGDRVVAAQNYYLVAGRFSAIRQSLYNTRYTFENVPDANGDEYAWTWPAGLSSIYLRPNFWALRPRYQVGAILHELTHSRCSTADYGYIDRQSLNRLPIRDPRTGRIVGYSRPNSPTYNNGCVFTSGTMYAFNADTYNGFLQDYYLDDVPN